MGAHVGESESNRVGAMATDGRLTGKRALITAAGQGIGRASAECFVREGAHVVACDINAEALKRLPTVHAVTLDVTDGAAVAAMMREQAPFDILFNCAGVVADGSILDCSEDEWEFGFDLNVKAMFQLIKLALPGMMARNGGSIINMSSVASSIKGVPRRFVYSATKAAVIGLTKSVAADFVTHGIRCNAICPGTVDTPSLHDRLRATGDYDQAMKTFIARQPMGRLGRADEVAALALYLASEDSMFVTGQTHIIDGGWAI